MKEERSPKWPSRRLKQIKTLELILNEIASIDSANHIICRLERLIELQETLRGSLQPCEKPFTQFLIDEAWEEDSREGFIDVSDLTQEMRDALAIKIESFRKNPSQRIF